MLNLVKRSLWIQTVAVRLIAAIHPSFEHNIGKTLAIKKAFYHAFLEEIAGDYLEFGTFEGTSLIAAFESAFRLKTPTISRSRSLGIRFV